MFVYFFTRLLELPVCMKIQIIYKCLQIVKDSLTSDFFHMKIFLIAYYSTINQTPSHARNAVFFISKWNKRN